MEQDTLHRLAHRARVLWGTGITAWQSWRERDSMKIRVYGITKTGPPPWSAIEWEHSGEDPERVLEEAKALHPVLARSDHAHRLAGAEGNG
jgi:hypothetical protein